MFPGIHYYITQYGKLPPDQQNKLLARLAILAAIVVGIISLAIILTAFFSR